MKVAAITLWVVGAAAASSSGKARHQSPCVPETPVVNADPVKTIVPDTIEAAPSAIETTFMISFGDSYSQTGFNLNGEKPRLGNPIGNPPMPGWTSSGGSNWVGFAANTYNASTLLSYNFAYGGATTAGDLVQPFSPEVMSFQDQVGQFSNGLASKPLYAPWSGADTLAAIWIGVNDVGNTFYGETQSLYGQIMDRYFAQLEVLYTAGVRQFALLGVPPIERTPSILSAGQGPVSRARDSITAYNSLLSQHLDDFKSSHSGVKAWLVDTKPVFEKALENPSQYGAPDATCYNKDGNSCLWFNDYHPGVAINKLVAEMLAKTVGMPFFKN